MHATDGWGQMSHSLAWAFRVSGLIPTEVFAFDGKSDAGVDYFDAAAGGRLPRSHCMVSTDADLWRESYREGPNALGPVRCANGATMAVSGAGTALVATGTRVEIFGSTGTLSYNGGKVEVKARGDKEACVLDGSVDDEPAIGQAGLWRFVERCRGERGNDTINSA
jgi:hypothetical protein